MVKMLIVKTLLKLNCCTSQLSSLIICHIEAIFNRKHYLSGTKEDHMDRASHLLWFLSIPSRDLEIRERMERIWSPK
jgi:hypothetical protein